MAFLGICFLIHHTEFLPYFFLKVVKINAGASPRWSISPHSPLGFWSTRALVAQIAVRKQADSFVMSSGTATRYSSSPSHVLHHFTTSLTKKIGISWTNLGDRGDTYILGSPQTQTGARWVGQNMLSFTLGYRESITLGCLDACWFSWDHLFIIYLIFNSVA